MTDCSYIPVSPERFAALVAAEARVAELEAAFETWRRVYAWEMEHSARIKADRDFALARVAELETIKADAIKHIDRWMKVAETEHSARLEAEGHLRTVCHTALAYDAAIRRASEQGVSWVDSDDLDQLYAAWIDAVLAATRDEREERT